MEKLTDNQTQDWISEAQARADRGEDPQIGFGSSALSMELPPESELAALEARGYDPEWVQKYIDRLQEAGTGNTNDIRVAYILRGAFNALIDQINQTQGGN